MIFSYETIFLNEEWKLIEVVEIQNEIWNQILKFKSNGIFSIYLPSHVNGFPDPVGDFCVRSASFWLFGNLESDMLKLLVT